MKICICEPLSISEEKLTSLIRPLEEKGHEVVSFSDRAQNEEELIARVKNADIIVTANQPFGEKVVDSLKDHTYIDVAFTGTDHIGKKAAKEKNILISNAQGYATEAVAELVIASAIDLLRMIVPFDRLTRQSGSRGNLTGFELKGKTFGIVGTGAIGLRSAELAAAFGCRLLGWNRSEKEAFTALGGTYTDLNTLLKESDIVSLNVPLTESTKGLMNEDRIRLMKRSAILINTARGPVVDEKALVDALRERKIAGAALDVFEKEPPLDAHNPLFTLDNVLLTPHIAYATQESFDARADIVFDNIDCYLAGEPKNLVSE